MSEGRWSTGVSARSRRWRRVPVVVSIVLWLGAFVVGASPAIAHTELQASEPPAGASLSALPDEIFLDFATAIDVRALRIDLRGPGNSDLLRSGPIADPARANRVVVGANPAPAGQVVLSWSLLGPDGHPLQGTLTWTIAQAPPDPETAGAPVSSALTASVPPSVASAGSSSSPSRLEHVGSTGRALSYVGLSLVLGLPTFYVTVWPTGRRQRRAVHAHVLGVGLAAAGPLVRLGATVAGFGAPDGATAALGVVAQSRPGHALLAQIVLAPLAGALIWRASRLRPLPRPGRGWQASALGSAAALVWSQVQQGHAVEARIVSTIWQTLHVSAMSVWIGSLVGMLLFALPAWSGKSEVRAELRSRMTAFTSLAARAVGVLILSGTLLLLERWQRAGGLADDYTQVLRLKLLGVAAAVAAALAGHLALRRARFGLPRPGSLTRRLRDEVGALGAVLTLTAVLAGTSPLPANQLAEERPSATAASRVIAVASTSYAFEPSLLTTRAGEYVEIALTAEDTMHDLVVEGRDAPVAAIPGMTGSGFLQIDEAGTYEFYCSIEGHREAGMIGTLVVEP